MTSASPATRPPRSARRAPGHPATWLGAGVPVVVGGLVLLAHEITAVSLVVALTVLSAVTATATAGTLRLLAHRADDPEPVA